MSAENSAPYDLLLRNVRLVRPGANDVPLVDVGVRGEKVAAVGPALNPRGAHRVIDGNERLAFPGAVDAHMHTGIYSPLQDDSLTESRAAAQGGVTSSLNYFRSGQYYLNEGGPYAQLFPRVLELSKGRFHVDYAYHLAPIESRHVSEMESLVETHGVSSFKIFMFYGGYGLHGASGRQREFLMIGEDENYDLAHFEFVMRGAQRAMERFPALRNEISVSLHCETAEILNAYTRIVSKDRSL